MENTFILHTKPKLLITCLLEQFAAAGHWPAATNEAIFWSKCYFVYPLPRTWYEDKPHVVVRKTYRPVYHRTKQIASDTELSLYFLPTSVQDSWVAGDVQKLDFGIIFEGVPRLPRRGE